MKTLEFTVLSNDRMQDVVDQLYATFGLPFEGETVRSLLAPLLPQFVAQLPVMELEGSDVERHLPSGRSWNPAAYTVHVPFETLKFGNCPQDRLMDLWLEAAYKRNQGMEGPDFVSITCYCQVVFRDEGIGIVMQCTVIPMNVLDIEGEVTQSFGYVLLPHSSISASHGLSLVGSPSPHAKQTRLQRIKQHNDNARERKTTYLDAITKLGCDGLFRFTDGVAAVGQETMSVLVQENEIPDSWINISSIPDDECIQHLIGIYRPDGHGGLYQYELCELNLPFDYNYTDDELVKRYRRFRR